MTPAAGTPVAACEVAVNEVDATAVAPVVDGSLEGVVTGLIEGNNTLTATSDALAATRPCSACGRGR